MQKKKNILRRTISLMLALALFFMCTPTLVRSNAASTEELELEEKLSMVAAGIMDPAEAFGTLDPNTVPEAIDYADAVSRNHIVRLYSDEGSNLNTVVFLNIDGTKTLYTFDYPVKYVDSDGSIKDISLCITEATSGYQTAENSVMTTFSENISDGIILTNDETNITLVPVLPAQSVSSNVEGTATYNKSENPVSTATRLDNRTIQYYYDPSTTIEYSLTYTGFKEDIVVSEYTGQTQYEFILITNGYRVSYIDGSYYLVDDNEKIKASIGDIVVFTADEQNNTFGDIMVETIVEDQEYRMTILLDADYLSDSKTVYPIRIDPTIEINYNNNGAGAIEDVTIHSNSKSNGYNNVVYVGTHEEDGIARILMKFPGLDLSSLGNNATIQSATVTIRDLMCESDPLEVNCHVYTGASWNEATANGTNNAPGGVSTFLSSATISYSIGKTLPSSHRYSFDITKAVRGWYDGIYEQDKGIIFKAHADVESGTDFIRKTIGSYNRGSYVPTLTVTYSIGGSQLIPDGTYYINNIHSGNYLFLKEGNQPNITGKSGLLSELGASVKWQIAQYHGGYVIRSVETPYRYLAVPDDTSKAQIEVVTNLYDEIPEECFWKITASRVGGCILQSAYNGRYLYSATGSLLAAVTTGSIETELYKKCSWRIIDISHYGNSSTYRYSELSQDFSISDIRVDVGETSNIPIEIMPSNALWVSLSDFRFSIVTTEHFSFDSNTGTFVGKTRGPAVEITATHKVTGLQTVFSVTVNSNISNFVIQMGTLYDAAYEYKNCNSEKAIEAVFNFIGGQKYNSGMWPGVIGEWDVGFRDYVQENYIQLYDYFICDSTKLINNDYIITLIDPSTGGEIDVLHMAATLNRFFYTGDTTYQGIPTFGIVDSIVDDLCGWAGDFQALIRDYFEDEPKGEDKNTVYQEFYPMIGSEDYFCSYSDIITDMDSSNLHKLLSNQSITSGNLFKEILLGYYTGDSGNVASRRFSTWVGDLNRADLYEKVLMYCNDHSTILSIKWPILNSYSIYTYQQKAFADAFVDYLLEQKGKEI